MKLAAIKDALDRSGIQSKTAVSVEVGVKPFEMVFDSIIAGPRDSEKPPNVAIESADEIVGEFDDDLPTIERDGESESESDAVIDVEVVADEYTDADAAIMSTRPGPITPDQDQTELSVDPGSTLGPLGMTGPARSGLMTLDDAVEAQREMMARSAGRVRGIRRR